MKFSYNWLKEIAGFREAPEKIAELLNFHTFEVETVTKVGSDFSLDAKIPTNRISDAGNHIGLAAEIAAVLNSEVERRKTNIRLTTKSDGNKFPISVKIAKPELCPRYSAVLLEINSLGESPKWMQERLQTCGMRAVNGIIDITNYVMLETGQPLHAFDLEKIRGGKITIRESKEGERLTTLDGTKHKLPQGMIIIEDRERLIDLAGIMGGENSAVSEKTRKILLQAAVFNPVRIYKTTRALGFTTDAARIYAAGTDLEKTADALTKAVKLMQKLGILKSEGESIEIYPKKAASKFIQFRPDYANRIIGQTFSDTFYKKTFEKLGLEAQVKEGGWFVLIPPRRLDLNIEEDLIEEAARMRGFQNIEASLPQSMLLPVSSNPELFWTRKVSDILAGLGFNESILYEFTGRKELKQFFIDEKTAVELENPMNPETEFLSPKVLTKLVASTAENTRGNAEARIFSFGKNFKKTKDAIKEETVLLVTLARKGANGEEEFYELKGAIEQMFEKIGINDSWYDDAVGKGRRGKEEGQQLFHPYRVAEIKVGSEKIGNLGEIHPAVLDNLKCKTRIVAAEIDFEKLWKIARAEQKFRPIGKYPGVVRDIAVIVPENTKADSVQEIIENMGGELLADSDLFDYFEDQEMREREEKSLAFHLMFQSPNRTLTDEEVNDLVEKIIKALEQKGWEVRK